MKLMEMVKEGSCCFKMVVSLVVVCGEGGDGSSGGVW